MYEMNCYYSHEMNCYYSHERNEPIKFTLDNVFDRDSRKFIFYNHKSFLKERLRYNFALRHFDEIVVKKELHSFLLEKHKFVEDHLDLGWNLFDLSPDDVMYLKLLM